MTERGITSDSIEHFHLGADRHRLTIPYLTPAGPINIKYRCIDDHDCKTTHGGKYGYDTGATQHLYNASTLLTADEAVITEGEMDAIAATQLGLSAVGYPGTASWMANRHWRWCFDSVRLVVVVADGDEPGRKAAAKIAGDLRNTITGEVRITELPDGEDSNSFINTYGDIDYLSELGLL